MYSKHFKIFYCNTENLKFKVANFHCEIQNAVDALLSNRRWIIFPIFNNFSTLFDLFYFYKLQIKKNYFYYKFVLFNIDYIAKNLYKIRVAFAKNAK